MLSDWGKLDKTASSSNDVLLNNDASSSNAIWLPGNDDLLYVSLLFDEQMTRSDSENENLQDSTVDIEVSSSNKDKSLQDILLDLNTKINHTEISKFNMSRGHLWEGAVRGLKRKSFSPANKISVKYTDDFGIAEGAFDSGGPMREFFTLIIDWMASPQLFCGSERQKYLSVNANYLSNDYYFYVGQLIAISTVHGGPGLRCFS